jgi:hypothetical protein
MANGLAHPARLKKRLATLFSFAKKRGNHTGITAYMKGAEHH